MKPRTRPRTCGGCAHFHAGWCRAFDIARKPTQVACLAPRAIRRGDTSSQTQAEWGSQ